MISLTGMTISLNGKEEKVDKLVVGYMTICGLTLDLDEAFQVCEAKGLDPETSIKAVPVAIGETLIEVM